MLFLKAVWWVAKIAFKVFLWTIAHPVATIAIGVGLGLAGAYISQQEWAGAAFIGQLLSLGGVALTVWGFSTVIGGLLFGRAEYVGRLIGRFLIPPWFQTGMEDLARTVYGVAR